MAAAAAGGTGAHGIGEGLQHALIDGDKREAGRDLPILRHGEGSERGVHVGYAVPIPSSEIIINTKKLCERISSIEPFNILQLNLKDDHLKCRAESTSANSFCILDAFLVLKICLTAS